MTREARKLLDEALQLEDRDRADLAAELLASLDGPADPDWAEAWAAELDRRLKVADERGAPLPEWAEVRKRVLERLAKR